MNKYKVVFVLSRKEIKVVDAERQVYDLGLGMSARLTCWAPDGEYADLALMQYVYVKDKDGYIRMDNGGYLVLA